MDPILYCREVCQQSHSNFVKTFRFLSKPQRLGFEAFYAFCRLVDDAVDEAASPELAARELAMWKQEVTAIYKKTPQTPVGLALQTVISRYKIPQEHLDELILGCEMDLSIQQYETFEQLKQYCYRVASCVGLVCLHLFEAPQDKKTVQAAIDLGLAVQLTNIIRDIKVDLNNDRIYLPLEDLTRFSLNPLTFRKQIESNTPSSAMTQLIRFQIERAEKLYGQAWSQFPTGRGQRKKLLTAYMMGKIYENILAKIAQQPLQVLQEKVGISSWHKLRISGQLALSSYLPL